MANELAHPPKELELDSVAAADVGKAVGETQAALVIAKRFPRNEEVALEKIVKACKRRSLAEVAIYGIPRGGQTITGPSIRLCETMAKAWGNLDFGIQEIDYNEEASVIEAYCWDLETNVKRRRRLTVPHKILLRTGATKFIKDPKEISEMVAAMGQRQVRQCILSVMPADITEEAMRTCEATLEGKDELPDIKRMLAAFDKLTVTQLMIENRYKKNLNDLTTDEHKELRKIYVSLQEGQTRREDWFNPE